MTYSNACEATNTGGVTSWEDGPCIVIEYGGCTYPQACNYDPGAGFEDGSCTFPPESCSWPDSWAAGCTYADATNYDVSAVVDDGSCSWAPCSTCTGREWRRGHHRRGHPRPAWGLWPALPRPRLLPHRTLAPGRL